MLDIHFLREHPQEAKASEQKRNRNPAVVDEVLNYDAQWKKALRMMEELKHKRNVVSEEINNAKKAAKEKEAQAKIKEMKDVVASIRQLEADVQSFLQKRDAALLQIGNIMHPDVPAGKNDADNVELKTWGKKPAFAFPLKDHAGLCESLGIADFDASAKTSGNGFYFLKGELALLNQALLQFAMDCLRKKKYLYVEPPLLLRKEILGAAINLEEWAKSVYGIEGEDLALIGTSEFSLLGMHGGEAIPEQELPKKYYAYSMCFRKEVGSHGINEKGLWRTHQFNKVEQFIFCRPEDSGKYFDELLKNSEEILQALKLPYRVIEICSGDLSQWKQRSYDVEVWRPTIKEYGEVMSLSNCTDYQARKLSIKAVAKDGSRQVVHTLNNTAMATSRIMVAILENFQTRQGTVNVPQVLWKYMKGVKEIGKKKEIGKMRERKWIGKKKKGR